MELVPQPIPPADQASPAPPPEANHSTASLLKDAGATQTWRQGPVRRLDALGQLPSIAGYETLKLLGRGGMGYVVQARDLKLDRLVALKLPLPEKLQDDADRERFLREARSAARLRHHGICPIYEIGEAAGQPYLALAFIAGQPLSTWAKEQSPTARQAAEIVAAVAEAVQAAHEHDVVHRDLKPGNVMIEHATGAPILMDFGLAKDQSEVDVHLTYDGAILGTPAYMSPEQAAGAVDKVGRSSDVYGLGAILYWLLCGRAPFAGTFGEVVRLVQTAEPAPLRKLHSGLHRDLETICRKAMAKEPRDRYASAQALAADLRRFTNGEAIQARPEGTLGKLWRTVRRRPGAAAALAAIVVVLAIAGMVARQTNHDRQVRLATQRFDNNLQADVWNPARYEQLAAQIPEIEQLSPVEARQSRERLDRRFREHLQQAIQRPSLGPHDLDKIRLELAFFATRNALASSELRQELETRLRAWKTVFDLSPPYADLPAIFAASVMQSDGSRLMAGTANSQSADDRNPTLVKSLVDSGGNVELKATFTEAAWSVSQPLGLTFNVAGTQGYQFVLAIAQPSPVDAQAAPAAGTLGAELAAGRSVELQIVRNGLIVRRQTVPAGGKTFELSAQRESGRISCQLNNGPPLVYEDIFPLGLAAPGVFGLVLPPGAEVKQVQAARQVLPSQPSPLERGDFFLANQQVQEAFESYREQEAGAAVDVRQESRTKQALCLLQLNREDDAGRLLEQVANENGDRWPIVAACHLWQLRLHQARFDDAELIREVLASRYQFEQLASLLPDYLRRSVINEYLKAAHASNLLTFNEERLRRMERVVETERLVAGQPQTSSQLSLLRGYRAAEHNEKAQRLAAQILDSPQELSLALFDRIWLVEEYCWLLRLEDQADKALKYVNRRLAPKGGEYRRQEWLPLLVERARIQAARGEPELAEADLAELLANVPIGQLVYRHYSAARLLQGFLRDERGDSAGAQEAWAAGIYRVWHPQFIREADAAQLEISADIKRQALPAENPNQFSGAEFVQFIMLSSLSDQLTEAEAGRIFGWLTYRFGTASDNSVLTSLVSVLQGDLALRTFRGLCSTPRGRQLARGVAFQTLSLAEVAHQPLHLIIYEIVHQGALPQGLSEPQDQLIWQAAQEVHAGFLAGKISKAQLLSLAFTWKGQTGAFGWDGVAGGLDPTIRGYTAFLFGHRMLQLKQPQEAAKLFRTAIADAGAASLLRAQAEQELKRGAAAAP